ncbi:MAG TPA: hypothetical protein VFX20_19975 [Steroidobacteraceae bacterium]|nr:hypothetical protein [Steroidobacteraceae bacterium]
MPPVKRGRGRPPRGESNGEALPIAKTPGKDTVRAALEDFRARVKTAKLAAGEGEANAQWAGTSRALELLQKVGGAQTLAGLPENLYPAVIKAAAEAAI